MACFVKVYGVVFLGVPRTEPAAGAHEAPVAMRGPMLLLAAGCALIGLVPGLVVPVLDAVITGAVPEPDALPVGLADLVPLPAVGATSLLSTALILLLTIALIRSVRRARECLH